MADAITYFEDGREGLMALCEKKEEEADGSFHRLGIQKKSGCTMIQHVIKAETT